MINRYPSHQMDMKLMCGVENDASLSFTCDFSYHIFLFINLYQSAVFW